MWRTRISGSFRFFLSRELAENFFSLFDIFQSELAGFDQVGHYGLSAIAEEREQVIDQFSLRGITRDRGFKNVEVTHLLDPAHGLFGFETIDGCLDGGIGRTLFFWKGFLHFANGGLALGPQCLHYL